MPNNGHASLGNIGAFSFACFDPETGLDGVVAILRAVGSTRIRAAPGMREAARGAMTPRLRDIVAARSGNIIDVLCIVYMMQRVFAIVKGGELGFGWGWRLSGWGRACGFIGQASILAKRSEDAHRTGNRNNTALADRSDVAATIRYYR
jgi:hypothetical protein